ncbi:MAG: hypothetical protein ACREGL_00585 [Alphaproteobacteria bacterium]
MAEMSNRQYAQPYVFRGLAAEDTALPLSRIILVPGQAHEYDEAWLQGALVRHPNLLPIGDIEPVFQPLVPVCRELPTKTGSVDLLFANEKGLLTLVECKLWRNPEARRVVVAQILDYAKDLSQWRYEDLDDAVKRTREGKNRGLFALVNEALPEAEEIEFCNNVSKNLKRGRFLLMVVGDGIRESVENIAIFLQAHSGLHFTFSLVELALFRLPESHGSGVLVQPRVLARTVEIERAVVRVEAPGVEVVTPPAEVVGDEKVRRRRTITEVEFAEALLKADPEAAGALPQFLAACEQLGITQTFGDSSINLHWNYAEVEKINFGIVRTDGRVKLYSISARLDQIGALPIAESYLERVAGLLRGGSVIKKGSLWSWRVIQNGKDPILLDLLDVRRQWLALIQETQEAIVKHLSTRS